MGFLCGIVAAAGVIVFVPRVAGVGWLGIGYLAAAALAVPFAVAEMVARTWHSGFKYRCQDCGAGNQSSQLFPSREDVPI